EPTQVPRFLPLFAIALGVRFAVVVLGVILAALPPNPYLDPLTPTHFREEMRSGSARRIEPWYRFDARWLVNVARNGYAGADDGDRAGPCGPGRVALRRPVPGRPEAGAGRRARQLRGASALLGLSLVGGRRSIRRVEVADRLGPARAVIVEPLVRDRVDLRPR